MTPEAGDPFKLTVGASVMTSTGHQLGTIKEVAADTFKVDASGKPDFWMNVQAIMRVEDGHVMLGVEDDHLDEFKAQDQVDASAVDAIQVLIEMHGEAKAKFREILDDSDGGRAGQLWSKLMPELEVHEQMEEMHLYGPLREETSDAASGELGHYEPHHHQEVEEVKGMIEQSRGLEAGSDQWRGLITQIRDTLVDHMKEEEGEIFPGIRERWSETRLRDAARDMLEMKESRLAS